jgi:hypothetical protein
MDGGAVPYGAACGGAGLLDRPGTGRISLQEDISAAVGGWPAEDDGVSAGPQTSESQANLVEMWFQLPEPEKQELGALFSRMVMKLFRVVSIEEG